MTHPWFSKTLCAALFAILGLTSTALLANTEPRLALLIGNAAYKSSPLINPVNDVRLMEGALKDAGFTVIKAENASIREMRRLVRDFGDRLKASGGVGLFYFAGHGVQVRGENFLVSTDSDIRNEDEVADDALNANVILEKMQTAGNRMNLIILDACRNNPFAVKSRSAPAGLATMSAPSGSLVAYSTAPGSVASDGSGSNGLYTEFLAKVIREPGLPVEEVFKQVRASVRRASNNQQTPWENTALEGQFFFKAPAPVVVALAAPVQPAPVLPAAPSGPNPITIELAMWDSVKSANTAGEIQSYISRYPSGIFADVAKARIAALDSAASDRASFEKAANERAANERAAAEASLKAATERASTARNADPAALDMAFWDNVKGGRSAGELQAYLNRYPEGMFAMLAKSRIEEINAGLTNASRTSSPAQARVLAAGGIAGTLVMTDALTGVKTNSIVTVIETDAEKTVYSSGDIIAKNGLVLQLRVGDAILRTVSGALWTVPLKAGTSGEARVTQSELSDSFAGKITWKTVSVGDGRIQIDASVSYGSRFGQISVIYNGKWVGIYREAGLLVDSSSTELRAGLYTAANRNSSIFTPR